MKSYIEGSKFPLVDILGRKVPRIILGQHPYDGTTYSSLEKDQEFQKKWTGPQSMVELMKPLVQRFGLTAFREVVIDNKLDDWHRDAMRLTMKELDQEIAVILGTYLPTKGGSLNTSTYLYRLCYEIAGEEFAEHFRSDPLMHYRWFSRRKLSQKDLDDFANHAKKTSTKVPPDLLDFEVDYETLERQLNSCSDFNVPIFISNAAVRVLVLTKRFDELQKIIDSIKERHGNFLMATHYPAVIIPMVEEAGVHVDGYLVPINSDGVYMFPTPRHTIETIRKVGKPVLAMKPLGGGGFVRPEKTFQYIFKELNIPASMVGIGNMMEAEETLGAAARALSI